MIRKSKFLGAALVVALVMSSVAVTAVSGDVLTSESASVTTVTGAQGGGDGDKMTFHAGELKCTTITYAGTFSTGASSVLVTPTYGGCTTAGLASTIDMNGCVYRINITGGTSTAASLDIVCTGTNEITVTTPSVGTKKCIKHIPAQTDLTAVSGTNIGSGTTREITVDLNITNLKYSQTTGMAETGNCTTADNTTGGIYTGDATFTGSVSSAHVGIFLS
jgi:hypothetical protein